MRARWVEHGQPGAAHFAAMAAVLRTHQVIVGALDVLLKEHGLTRTAYLLMITLQMSPGSSRALGSLSRHMLVHPTTVTMLVDSLEARRLVRRRAHPTDRRTVLATLTPKGERLVSAASRDLAAANFGLGSAAEPLSERLTETLRAVRQEIADA